MDRLIRAISNDGFVSCTAISCPNACERARVIHNASRTAAAAIGRTLSAAIMLASGVKNDQASVTLRINGGGEIGSVIAVALPDGSGRVTATNPTADAPRKPNGKLDVGAIVGANGMLTVIRDMGSGEPYIGAAELVSGEIGDDVTQYLLISEQRASAVGLGVLINEAILSAGGFIVSLLPGAPESLIDTLELNIADMGNVTDILNSADSSPETLVNAVLRGIAWTEVTNQSVEYRCNCTRERVLEALAGIGDEETRDIEQKGEDIEVTCQFCDAKYYFTPSEVRNNLRL